MNDKIVKRGRGRPPITGRPTKLTPELKEKILSTVRTGQYIAEAAMMGGITRATFYVWKRKGEAGREPYKSFIEDLDIAMAQGEVLLSMVLTKAAQAGHWQAAARKLEAMYLDRWGRQVRLEGAVGIDARVKTDGEAVRAMIFKMISGKE